MQLRKNHNPLELRSPGASPRQPRRVHRTVFRMRASAAVLLVVAAMAAAQSGQQSGQQPNGTTPNQDPGPGRAWATSQLKIPDSQTGSQNFEAVNIERKKQIADESAKLLKLATDLKTEVDKTSKDTLSLNVIRKAEEIEKLAHDVKEKMKLTVGQS